MKATARSYPVQAPHIPPAATVKQENPLLSVRNLTHVYGDGAAALRDVSFDVYAGEYLLIVGQNGAGKSTLAKHFLRLLLPTSGASWV